MKQIKKLLLSISQNKKSNNSTTKAIQQLLDDGISLEEAKAAINMSIKENDKTYQSQKVRAYIVI